MNSAGQSRAPASSWACLHGAQRVALPRPKFRSLHRRQRAAVVRAAAAAPVPLAADAVAAQADATPAALQWFKRMQMEAAIPFSSAVEEVDVSGSARHAGVEMQWKLSCDSHGSFVECLTSPQMSCSWGYAAAATDNSSSSLELTGNSDSSTAAASSSQQPLARLSGGASHTSSRYFATDGVCWAADDAGCPQLLQLDDEEALLLSTYVRTGVWVLPSIAQLLEVTAVAPPSTAAAAAVAALAGQAAHPCPSGSSDSSPSSSRGPSSSSCSSSSNPSSSGGPSSSSSSSSSSSESGTAWVRLRMRGGGRVAALLELCSDSWRPLSMRLQMAGSDELWQLSGWREWQPGLWLATTAVQSNCSEGGVVNTFTADSVQLHSCRAGDRTPRRGTGIIPSDSSSSSDGSSSSSTSRFSPPLAPLLPADSSFLAGVPEEVPAWHTSSGHTLVRPLINGREVGYFIFDTGASGFVLDPAVAAELGLEGFGELQVTSMVGKVASRFRRAATFQLGPLLLQRPLLMELPCSGLVTGLPEGARLAGIVGHDVLRRAVVHMPPHPSRPPASTAATRDVDSPAAAVAAAVAAARARKTPLQLTLRLQHPGQPAVTAAAAAAAGSGTGAAAQAASSACAAAAAGTAAVMSGMGGPAPEATTALQLESSSKHASSSSSSSDTSMRNMAAKLPSPPPPPQQRPQPQPQWLQLVMVEGLPHIELELVSEGQRRHTGLFMIDSGAGGFDLILNSRAAHSLGLCPRASKEGNRSAGGSGSTTVIQGIGGGSTNRLAAQRRQLAEVRLGPAAFRAVTALVYGGSGGGGGGLSLSQHTSGIVCGGLLGRCSLVFDYPRMRMAVMCDAAASP